MLKFVGVVGGWLGIKPCISVCQRFIGEAHKEQEIKYRDIHNCACVVDGVMRLSRKYVQKINSPASISKVLPR